VTRRRSCQAQLACLSWAPALNAASLSTCDSHVRSHRQGGVETSCGASAFNVAVERACNIVAGAAPDCAQSVHAFLASNLGTRRLWLVGADAARPRCWCNRSFFATCAKHEIPVPNSVQLAPSSESLGRRLVIWLPTGRVALRPNGTPLNPAQEQALVFRRFGPRLITQTAPQWVLRPIQTPDQSWLGCHWRQTSALGARQVRSGTRKGRGD
jgi:hypothetical protein